MSLNPYLFFDGNCEEAFQFYAKVLNGKVEAMMKHTGTPAEEHVPADWGDKIIHASMKIGDDVLMASDAPPPREPMKGFSVALHYDDAKEGERVFNTLSEGGKVTMPFAETFFAERFGMLVDRFGTPWMINCPPKAA